MLLRHLVDYVFEDNKWTFELLDSHTIKTQTSYSGYTYVWNGEGWICEQDLGAPTSEEWYTVLEEVWRVLVQYYGG